MTQGASVCLFIISYVTDTMLGSGAIKISKVDDIPVLMDVFSPDRKISG